VPTGNNKYIAVPPPESTRHATYSVSHAHALSSADGSAWLLLVHSADLIRTCLLLNLVVLPVCVLRLYFQMQVFGCS